MQINLENDLAQLGEKARTFFRWWSGQLVACLPEEWQRATRFERARWVIETTDTDAFVHIPPSSENREESTQHFELQVESERKAATLALLKHRDPDTAELVLRLPGKKVLCKTIKLPLAAEENLRTVLGFELDQHTPFTAEQAYYDFHVMERDAATQRIAIRLIVVPRPALDKAVADLNDLGVSPDRVDVAVVEPGAEVPPFNLLPAEQRRGRATNLHGVNFALAAVAGLLLIGVIALPLWRKAEQVSALEAEIELAKKDATTATSLKKQIESLVHESEFLADQKARAPTVVAVLNDLSKLLQDDTWLYQFELNGGKISIQGESPASSAVLKLVDASKSFRKAEMGSPITQNRQTNAERFNLSAEVVTGKGS